MPAAALATMYDASLDQIFSGGNWLFSPYPNFYRRGGGLMDEGSFGNLNGQQFYLPGDEIDVRTFGLPRLDLGFFRPGGRPWAAGNGDVGCRSAFHAKAKRSGG